MRFGVVLLARSRCGGERRVSARVHAEDESGDHNDRASEAEDVVAIERDGPEGSDQQIAFPWIIRCPANETSYLVEREQEWV
jgi:hypothetical protein